MLVGYCLFQTYFLGILRSTGYGSALLSLSFN